MRQAGFTVLEILVTLVVIGVVVTLAAPAFGEMLTKHRREDAALQLANGLRTARAEAIIRSRPVVIRTIDGNWSNGWQIVVDPQNNQEGLILAERARSGKVPIVGNGQTKQSIRFNGLGAPAANGFVGGTLSICDPKQAISHNRVILSPTGRVRIENFQKAEKLCR